MIIDDLLLFAALEFEKQSTEKDVETLHEYIQECLSPEQRNIPELIDEVKTFRSKRVSYKWNTFRLFAPVLGIGLAATSKFPIFGNCLTKDQATDPFISYLSLTFIVLCTLIICLTIYRMKIDRPSEETMKKEKISRRVIQALEKMY